MTLQNKARENVPTSSRPSVPAPASAIFSDEQMQIAANPHLVHTRREIVSLRIADIKIDQPPIPLKKSDVDMLVASIGEIGQKTPVSVHQIGNGEFVLIDGWGRVEALRQLGRARISAVLYFELSQSDIRLIQIASNQRKNLSRLDRAEQDYEFSQLHRLKVSQLAAPAGGYQPGDKGHTKAAKALGASADQIARSEKIAMIHADAKGVIRELKLEDNQSAMLKIASAGDTAERQIACARELKRKKSTPKKPHQANGEIPSSITSGGVDSNVEQKCLPTSSSFEMPPIPPFLDRLKKRGSLEECLETWDGLPLVGWLLELSVEERIAFYEMRIKPVFTEMKGA